MGIFLPHSLDHLSCSFFTHSCHPPGKCWTLEINKGIMKQTLKMPLPTDIRNNNTTMMNHLIINHPPLSVSALIRDRMHYMVMADIEQNISHFLYPNDVAWSNAFLLRIPARHVNTILSACWGISPPYFSLKSSGPSWRAVFTCPTVKQRTQRTEITSC